jgi:HEAT repeat protein
MPATLDAAFSALRSYDQGSSRAALLPIDEAVVAALPDPADRLTLETRLLAALSAGGSSVALEYLCAKLTLIGSALAVPALAALLDQPALTTAARNALEAAPHPEATAALRAQLPKLAGLPLLGVVQSLGIRRAAAAVPALAALLASPSPEVSRAAAAALGEIGTPAAAAALRDFSARAPAVVAPALADALLVCAERLLAAGARAAAQSLYQLLATAAQPVHVRLAATRGLTTASTP